ncbi:MAG: glutamine amidotransferase [Kiritimatiellae bacterium]|nr:glutamine amidotransferase [Kiritimatiellia bacterium]
MSWQDAKGKELGSLACHSYGPQPDYRAVTFAMTAPVGAAAAVLKYAANVGRDCKGPEATAFFIDQVRLTKLAKVSIPADAPKWEYLNRVLQSGLKLADDKDAANGQAIIAEQGAISKNTVLAFGPYTKEQPVGEYLAIFRLKVKDNTRKEPVVSLDVGANGNFNYTLAGPRTVYANDFKQAGVYQDVALRFVRPDEGALEFRVFYQGATDLSYDKVTVIQLMPFRTDREQVAVWLGESGSLPPAVAMAPSTAAGTGDTVLVVAGLGNQTYFPANMRPNTLRLAYSYLAITQTGTVLDQPFPKNLEALKGVRLIVLADIPASALNGLMGRKNLRAFVENGGSLLVFGGPFAFGKGEYADSAFEPVLPITMTGPWDLVKTKAGVVKVAKTSPITAGLRWDERPSLRYYHRTTAKPDAETLLECDGFPVLVTGRYGKGKVAVFAGTYLGEPAKGNVLLYEWSGYSELLARVVQWLLNYCES